MILDDIVLKTKERYKDKLKNIEEIKKLASTRDSNEDFFYDAIRKPNMSFICEVKKASPSKGIISNDFNYLEIASKYNKCADVISCLTEPFFFKGEDRYLTEIKSIVDIPVLRKDFILYEYQIYEAKVIGADGILLICSILDDIKLKKYIEIAREIGLGALVEAHDEEEVKRAVNAGALLIGVNNRNLKDFSIDMNNSISLRKTAPRDILFVSESGIRERKDIKILEENNVDAVLIGETLMKSLDIIKTVGELRFDKD